jgi:hypothetical protein
VRRRRKRISKEKPKTKKTCGKAKTGKGENGRKRKLKKAKAEEGENGRK